MASKRWWGKVTATYEVACYECGACENTFGPRSYATRFFVEAGWAILLGKWYCPAHSPKKTLECVCEVKEQHHGE